MKSINKFILLCVILLHNTVFAYQPEDQSLEMPKEEAYGRVSTLNKTGWAVKSIDPYSQEFINWAIKSSKPSLEVGAAYGFVTIKAIEEGATIIANDLEKKHLDILKDSLPVKFQDRLITLPGDFLTAKIEKESLHGILASRILHFLDSKDLELAAKLMYSWLSKGGKAFIVADTPYLKPWNKFLPIYLERKEKGHEYPGMMETPEIYNPERAKNIPSFMHFLDKETLVKIFIKAGFRIEKVEYINRTDYPEELRSEYKKESIGMIAVKE